jgi:diguanylate cyclase (GGDEF)-like protein/PAS domain S-box-containing protein
MALHVPPTCQSSVEQQSSDASVVATRFSGTRDEERFWRRYMRGAFVVLALESVGALVYFRLSPTTQHPLALEVIAAITALAASGCLVLTGSIARKTWRARFSLGVALTSGAVLALCCYWDGGLDTPLLFLLALPVANAAIALSTRAIALCTGAVIMEFALVAATDQDVRSDQAAMVILSAFLAGSLILAWSWLFSRTQLDRDKANLLARAVNLAKTDLLTGCLNHGAFFERLDVEIARALRHSEPLSLLMADVDLFKAFNDAHGHAAGDEALALAGNILRSTGRTIDVVGRVGGDEFAVILPSTSLTGAHRIAERLSKALKHPDGSDISVSIGYATLDSTEPTRQRLFRDADSGLYLAKARGRSRAASTMVPEDAAMFGGERSCETPTLEADLKLVQERVRETNTAISEALAILDILSETDSIGFAVMDSQFRIIRINRAFAAVHGGTVEDQLGRTVSETVPALWPMLQPAYQAVLDSGKALTNQEIVGPTAADPGTLHVWTTNFYPVRAHGNTLGLCVIALDITDRKQLEDSQVALTRSVVGALASAVEMRDPYTNGHQERVAAIAVAIASDLGVDAHEIESIDLASRIHDVGKLAVPAELLSRPGRLTEAEMALVREHARAGATMLGRAGVPDHIRELILQHHERLDGSGYPDGLGGDQLSLGARIIAVADVVEAISSHRPYRPALGMADALQEIQRRSGTLYDPVVVNACVRLFSDGRLSLGDAADWTAGTETTPGPTVEDAKLPDPLAVSIESLYRRPGDDHTGEVRGRLRVMA